MVLNSRPLVRSDGLVHTTNMFSFWVNQINHRKCIVVTPIQRQRAVRHKRVVILYVYFTTKCVFEKQRNVQNGFVLIDLL